MRKSLAATALVVAAPFLAACTQNADSDDAAADGGDPRALSVESTDSECQVSAAEAPAGTLTFDVTNTGSQVTEFYLLGEDGLRIVAEVENIGPSLSREMTVNAPEGKYFTACKPGMEGEGIRADFTVTAADDGSATTSSGEETWSRRRWSITPTTSRTSPTSCSRRPRRSSSSTRTATTRPPASSTRRRAPTGSGSRPWPSRSATSTPRWTAREADLEPGQKWTGWHLIEKDLWPQRAEDYTALTRCRAGDVRRRPAREHPDAARRGSPTSLTPSTRSPTAPGACSRRSPLGKVTGEEEYWSHTDLWDFQANVDGARVGYEGLEPIVEEKDPQLASDLDARFSDLQVRLDAHEVGDGFKTYDQLTPDEVKELSDAVNALSEPLSKLTAAVLS